MGNGVRKLSLCFSGSDRLVIAAIASEPLDEGLGHSFCYVRPDPSRISSWNAHTEESAAAAMVFRSISGASVCANVSTPLSTAFADLYSDNSVDCVSATFESSDSFASVPLQPLHRLNPDLIGGITHSGPIERGFLSGPIERGFLSGPLDHRIFSGPFDGGSNQFQRSFSHSESAFRLRSKKKKGSLIRVMKKAIAQTVRKNSIVAPVKSGPPIKKLDSIAMEKNGENVGTHVSSDSSFEGCDSLSQNLQWAQGKAGEDRVHVVLSEEHGWLFVGIYDGFNGPDAPDYLLSNLYSAVHKELKGLVWENKLESAIDSVLEKVTIPTHESDLSRTRDRTVDSRSQCVGPFGGTPNSNSNSKRIRSNNSRRFKGSAKKTEENRKRWKCRWDTERLELDKRFKDRSDSDQMVNHSDVLKALSRALRKTEAAYLKITDKMVTENPELALMGSCVLVMLMKGEDVYLMNVGDSRVVIARKPENDVWGSLGKAHQDLDRINEETSNDLDAFDGHRLPDFPNLMALQLTLDHSTCVEEEVQRIKKEHPDDASAVVNDRVKGSLKVTRAFGAGFLKQPKWNNALLEMFRIDYVGMLPYITCAPSLYHHRIESKDRFLILSSDGLYEYFTNEEVVSEVEMFITSSPEGDPAQHLIQEVLFRAAKKAGMDFHELLEIPQGDRRQYHDDVTVIIISLEGRIWKSSVNRSTD
ncbi:probable protein phosphatase 2C 23 [Magnolia sinica]|uniref:probable protein phosphatase 2C 23 n=1 Tax=Magnolia sinica TaxID=86752 RepID=UPI002657B474|nr:probable protein phosphatase 2C 23 [Magnolia sinica]